MTDSKVIKAEGKESEQRRDALLLKLLKTPPQPRPKRERGKPKLKSGRKPKSKSE